MVHAMFSLAFLFVHITITFWVIATRGEMNSGEVEQSPGAAGSETAQGLPWFDDQLQKPAPPPKKRWSAFWVTLIVLAGSLVLLVGLFVLAVALYIFTAQQEEMTATERSMLLDIEELAPTMIDFDPAPAHETVLKQRYYNGTFEIDYVYDDLSDETSPFLNYNITFEVRVSDAIASYHSMWTALTFTMSAVSEGEMSIQDRDHLFSWGDQSRFVIVTIDGLPVGNLFIARKGERIVSLILTGVYFDDSIAISELLLPQLNELDQYQTPP